MSKGTDVVIYIAKEQAPNTLPPTPVWKTVRRTSDSLDERTTTTASDEVINSRFEQGSSATSGEAGGSINFEFSAGSQDIFFEGVAGNVFVEDALTDVATLEIGGPELPTFTIVKHDNKLGLIEVFSGCRIGELSITGDTEGKITGSVTVSATGYDDTLTTSPVISPEPPTETTFMSAVNVDAFKVDGVSTVGTACAESFTITINNNLTAKPCMGNKSLIPNRYSEGLVSISLSATVVLTETSQAWKAKIKSRDTLTSEIGIEDADGNAYGFNFTKLQLDGADKSETNATDDHTLSLEFKHIKVAPTITRILV